MRLRHALYACAMFVLGCAGASAQEDPEAVYARLHRALLAGNAEEVAGYSTAATRAELAAKPQAERNALMRAMAQAAPRTYTVTEKSIAPDGNSATLRGTGISEFQTRAEAYLTASFRKEGEAWKVASWAWSNQKPPPIANPAKPDAPAAAKPAEPVAPPQVVITRKLGPLPAAAPDRPAAAAAAVTATRRPSRAHLDARACLRQRTDRAIMECAEKYR
ncbi:MAG: nuclear transport factor 2 family protein [Sulfuritalea sp.]|nr:nuclear transport factor 2 family protein [Sulfuritalea sp.]